jgi:FSR family fosmidomycin resistance protein-like MFS transporter
VTIAFAQELVPDRAGTASSLVMGFGWGLAGLGLVAFGSLAELITVPRALDVAALIPLLAAGLALALPASTAAQPEQTALTGDIALQK